MDNDLVEFASKKHGEGAELGNCVLGWLAETAEDVVLTRTPVEVFSGHQVLSR